MKKLTVLATVLAMAALTLTSCDLKSKGEPKTETEGEPADTLTKTEADSLTVAPAPEAPVTDTLTEKK